MLHDLDHNAILAKVLVTPSREKRGERTLYCYYISRLHESYLFTIIDR